MTYARRLLLLVVMLSTAIVSQAQTPAVAAHKEVLDGLQSITTIPLENWSAHAMDLAHGEAVGLDTSSWNAAKVGDDWDSGRWLRYRFEVPQQWQGYDLRGASLRLDLSIDSNEGVSITTFLNGNMAARTDGDNQVPLMLTANAQPGQTFEIAVRVFFTGTVGCCGGKPNIKLTRAQLMVQPPASRPDPGILRLEILSAEPLIAAYEDGKAQREEQLDAAVKAIDPDALKKNDQGGFDSSLRVAQQKLEVLKPYMRQFRIAAVGNSHIDMAWLWPWTETVEVVRNTFGTVLELMREYPDFKFTASAAQAYSWIEDKYPAMFAEIEQRVKEGRWEVIGGMWVEPDLNLPDGESLVRQILYGKRYFQQKFGIDVNIGWNPDSFGYNAQLPQIYKRAGMDSFVTQKLLWAHEFTVFPYRLFWWEAPDGSRLLTYFPSEYANPIDPLKMARDSATYGPAMWKFDGGKGDVPAGGLRMMYLYGVGDHGGGPTRKDLGTALRWQKPDVVYPQIEFSTAKSYIDDLEAHENDLKLPTWKGELYFQYHRGVQTTQAEEKKGNRKNEVLILDAEKLASIDMLLGGNYPQADFDAAWKKILFNQFHDILPGSGIHINYVDAAEKYAETSRFSNDTIAAALKDIAAHVKAGIGQSVLVFNPLSWERTDEVEADIQEPLPWKGEFFAWDSNEKPVPADVLSFDPATGKLHARFLVEKVPATGYKLIHTIRPSTGKTDVLKPPPLSATDTSLENEFVRLKIDAKTGCMTSLFDKRSNTESLAAPVQAEGAPPPLRDGPCGNLLQAFVDKPQKWDAWNVDADFVKQHTDLMQADEVKLVENTPLRAVIRVRQHFQNSTFIQDITLYPGMPRVDVRMQTEWHEKHILLKVAFPVSVKSDKATYEIPYGTVERPTTRNTPAEQAQFEVPALRWADLSDATHGLSLLNDSKYGYDCRDNVLRLSLLRSPEYPDPHADEGHHEFTYSLYPHAGTWREGLTVRQGYELNYPLLATTTTPHAGALPASQSFLSAKESNVVITAAKKDADDDSLIVRFYEWDGHSGDIHLTLPQAATVAEETNEMEKPEHGLTLEPGGKVVVVPTNAYEIKTLRVSFGNAAP